MLQARGHGRDPRRGRPQLLRWRCGRCWSSRTSACASSWSTTAAGSHARRPAANPRIACSGSDSPSACARRATWDSPRWSRRGWRSSTTTTLGAAGAAPAARRRRRRGTAGMLGHRHVPRRPAARHGWAARSPTTCRAPSCAGTRSRGRRRACWPRPTSSGPSAAGPVPAERGGLGPVGSAWPRPGRWAGRGHRRLAARHAGSHGHDLGTSHGLRSCRPSTWRPTRLVVDPGRRSSSAGRAWSTAPVTGPAGCGARLAGPAAGTSPGGADSPGGSTARARAATPARAPDVGQGAPAPRPRLEPVAAYAGDAPAVP